MSTHGHVISVPLPWPCFQLHNLFRRMFLLPVSRFRGMLQEELSSCAPELDPSVAAQVCVPAHSSTTLGREGCPACGTRTHCMWRGARASSAMACVFRSGPPHVVHVVQCMCTEHSRMRVMHGSTDPSSSKCSWRSSSWCMHTVASGTCTGPGGDRTLGLGVHVCIASGPPGGHATHAMHEHAPARPSPLPTPADRCSARTGPCTQALTLDLDALAASLARLPLQQLLGLPPAHAGWLAQEESARGLAKADLLHQPLPEPKWRRDPPHPPIGKPTQAAQQAPPPPPVPARPQPVQQPHPPPVRAQHQPPAPQPPQPQPQLQQQSAHAHDEELDMLLGLSGPPTLPVPASTQAASTPALTPCQPPVHVQSVGLVGGTGTTSSAVHPYQPPVHVQSVGLVGGPGTTSSAIHPKPPSALPLLRSSAVPTVPRYPQQPQLPQQPQQHRHDDELDELLGL